MADPWLTLASGRTIRIEPGCIDVNMVHVARDSDGALMLQFDTVQKYAEVLGPGYSETDIEVLLSADENTMHVREGVSLDLPTRVRVWAPRAERWHAEASGGRYTVTLIAVREREEDAAANGEGRIDG
jgi:hypothetical protein